MGSPEIKKEIILFIEDDLLPTKWYVMTLRRTGHDVRHLRSPDEAMQYVENNGPASIIVLDIMMPPGERYRHEDTQDGLLTGVYLYNDLRKYYKDVHFILLTNVSNPTTLAKFEVGPLLSIFTKLDNPAIEFAERVQKIVANSHARQASGLAGDQEIGR